MSFCEGFHFIFIKEKDYNNYFHKIYQKILLVIKKKFYETWIFLKKFTHEMRISYGLKSEILKWLA